MDLFEFTSFQCISIYLNNVQLYAVEPVPYIVFFVNSLKEKIKILCCKDPNDKPIYPREILIPWDQIKNVTITEHNGENRIIIDFVKSCEHTVCELFVEDEVFSKLESTLSLMYIRSKEKQGRTEKEARASILVLSAVEDSDFGMEEDMIKSASNSSSFGIIPSSFQTIEDSLDIYATASEEITRTIECTPYVVEDTPPATQQDPETNIIPCTPTELQNPPRNPAPEETFYVYEDYPLTQEENIVISNKNASEDPEANIIPCTPAELENSPKNSVSEGVFQVYEDFFVTQDENIIEFSKIETESEKTLSSLSEGDFGGIVVLETDYDTHSNCSDGELDVYVQNTLSNLKIVADASQEKQDISERIEVISVGEKRKCSAQEAMEMISNSEIILLNDVVASAENTQNRNSFRTSGVEEIVETPKSSFRRSRKSSVEELNDVRASQAIFSEKGDENNNESQTVLRMLQEDNETRNKDDDDVVKSGHLIELIDQIIYSLDGKNEITAKEDGKENKPPKKKLLKRKLRNEMNSIEKTSEKPKKIQHKPSTKKKLLKNLEVPQDENKENENVQTQNKALGEKNPIQLLKKQKVFQKEPKSDLLQSDKSSQHLKEDEAINNKANESPKRVLKKLKVPTTPSKSLKKNMESPKFSKKRYAADSDSDEWTPHGIIKYKKVRESLPISDKDPLKESFFSLYSRGTTLTKTRTRVVTRSNRFCDELNSDANNGRRKNVSSSSESDDNDEDFIKTVITRQNSTNIFPDHNTTQNTNYSFKPKESVIVQNRSQNTPSTPSRESSIPRTPKRRLSRTPKFAFNEEAAGSSKSSLSFAFVRNEEDFNKSFQKNLSQSSETEDTPSLKTNHKNNPSESENPEKQDGELQSSGLKCSREDIPATDLSKKPYKPFLIFTSESSNCNYSSPESPKNMKNRPTKRLIKKNKLFQSKIPLKRKILRANVTKRPVFKRIENQLPPVILSNLPSLDLETSNINNLKVQPYLFQDVPGSQENDVDITRRKVKAKKLLDKINKELGKQMGEKQFYLLAIEVFTMCLKCLHNLQDTKELLLVNFNKIYFNILKLILMKP